MLETELDSSVICWNENLTRYTRSISDTTINCFKLSQAGVFSMFESSLMASSLTSNAAEIKCKRGGVLMSPLRSCQRSRRQYEQLGSTRMSGSAMPRELRKSSTAFRQ